MSLDLRKTEAPLAAQPRRNPITPVQPASYSTLSWRTSRASAGAGECVEVAAASPLVLARDSRDRSGPVLRLTSGQWTGMLDRIKNGDLNSG
jgi:hypothetical protein